MKRARIPTFVTIATFLLSALGKAQVCDPILCINDQRVSTMGGLGTAGIHVADDPAVAYNETDNEFLVVWAGTENDSATEQTRIYGQRTNAFTGAEIGGDDIVIGETPGAPDPDRDAVQPAVVYNSTRNEYLVVWVGEEDVSAATET